jgi:hypothetical protein
VLAAPLCTSIVSELGTGAEDIAAEGSHAVLLPCQVHQLPSGCDKEDVLGSRVSSCGDLPNIRTNGT